MQEHANIVIVDDMPSPSDVIAVMEDDLPAETSAEVSVDEEVFLRLRASLRESAVQPLSVDTQANASRVEIIRDVDPPIHIQRVPSQ